MTAATTTPTSSASVMVNRKHANLARNSLLNFSALAVQLLATLALMPVTFRVLGPARIGVLSLVWAGVGYFSVLDLGIGRAVTQAVSVILAAGDQNRIRSIFLGALTIQVSMGAAAGVLLLFLSHWLVGTVLRIPPELRSEARLAFVLCACALPLVFFTSSLNGLLQAAHRFDIPTAVSIPTSILIQALPVVVSWWRCDLSLVVGSIVAARCISALVLVLLMRRVYPQLFRRGAVKFDELRRLLAFGSWVTVSNLINPLLTYADRFVIGALLTISAVTYYVVPYEAAMRLLIVSNSVGAALFPVLSASSASPQRVKELLSDTARMLLVFVGFPVVILLLFGFDVLRLWMGDSFAQQAGLVLPLLSIGVLASSLASLLSSALQASGRPDVTAKFHLFELLPHSFVLWACVLRWGIEGAAVAWTVRVVLDACLLLWACKRIGVFPQDWRPMNVVRPALVTALLTAAALPAARLAPGIKCLVLFLTAITCYVYAGQAVRVAVARLGLSRPRLVMRAGRP